MIYRRNSRNGWGWVYVVGFPSSGRLKVGTTRDLENRISGLHKRAGGRAHCFYAAYTDNRLAVEHRAHRLLRRYALGQEWFGCTPTLAAAAVYRASLSAPPLMMLDWDEYESVAA